MSGAALDLPPGFIWVVVVVFGAMVGSFLNVVIYRLPRIEGIWNATVPSVPLPVIGTHPIEVGDHTVAAPLPVNQPYSLAWPPSHCPRCQNTLAWHDNIPIASWLLLIGRCRFCNGRISLRYPLVEGTVAALFAGLYAKFGISPMTLAMMALVAAMIAILWIDLDTMIIPDSITMPMVWTGLLFCVLGELANSGMKASEGVLGAIGGYAVFRAIEAASRLWLKKEGMGRGDAKLAAMMGAWLGPKGLAVTLFVGFLVGSLAGILVELIRRQMSLKAAIRAVVNHDSTPFPFGPSLVVGGLAGIFIGPSLVDWYFGLVQD